MEENKSVVQADHTRGASKKLGEFLGMNPDMLMGQLQMVATRVLTPERMVRVALTQFTKNPKLRECDQKSIFVALMDAQSMGIEPDGRRAHLIPYGKECKLMLDYKGIMALAKRSGEIVNIHAELVCENDKFLYDKCEVRQHIIDFKNPRGNPYAVYSYVRFKDGTEDYEVMTREEVEAIRKRSRAGQSGPWVTDPGEMWKKTVIRRHSKRWTLDAEFAEALDKDIDTFEVERDTYTVKAESTPDKDAVPGAASAKAILPKAKKSKEPPKEDPTSALRAILDSTYDDYVNQCKEKGQTPMPLPNVDGCTPEKIETIISGVQSAMNALDEPKPEKKDDRSGLPF